MLGGEICHMLPHLPGVPHLHLECSVDYKGYIVSKPEVMVKLGAN